MSYTKNIWVNDNSPYIDATNLNNIESGIENAHAVIDTVANVYNPTYGADGGGSVDDTTAIQDAIDAMAAQTNGGTVVIPDGDYLISETLTWKPKVSFVLSPYARLLARTASFTGDAMVEAPVGTRLSNVSWSGGQINGRNAVDILMNLEDFEGVYLNGIRFQRIKQTDGIGLYMGDAAQSANCYELMARDLHFEQSASEGVGSTSQAAIDCYQVSDSHFSDIIVEGARNGMIGAISGSRFHNCHVWAYEPTQGTIVKGFGSTGNNCSYDACQVDGPFTNAFYTSGDNHWFDRCRANGAGIGQADNSGTGLYVDVSAGASNVTWNSGQIRGLDGTHRIAAAFNGSSTWKQELVVSGNVQREHIVNNNMKKWGSGEIVMMAEITAGASPTVNSGWNTSTSNVTQNATGDYTITFDEDLATTEYTVSTAVGNSGTTQLTIEIYQKNQVSVRVRFRNSAGTLTDPDEFDVWVIMH